MPGAGKTVLTSIVVDYLCNNFQDNTTIGIAYLYCNFRKQAEQKAADLLASLLKQLSEQQPALPDSIRSLYHSHRHKRTRPTVDDMSRVLQAVATLYSRISIVIDALDECQVSDGSRSRFLSNVSSLQTRCRANILVTSRFLPEISEGFKHAIALEIRASNEDVRRYLNGHLFRLPSFIVRSPELQEEVTMRIIQSVQGMFLLAQLHLESLIGKRSAKVLRNTLTTLPSGSKAYDHAYRDAMNRIEGQITDQEQLAKQVLSWITCAKRPLTVLELQHALAVEVGTPNIDEENLPDIGDIVSTCAGLVTVDEESNIIRLAHYTTQEYFERTWTSWFPNAQSDITVTCVTYLLFHAFETGFCFTDREFERRLYTNVLYDYAARYWGHHARVASTVTKQLILSFLESQAKLSASSQALMAFKSYNGYSQRIPKLLTPLHISAYFGLKEITIYLLENGCDPNLQDTHGQTPLSWAARNGHEAVVKLLMGEDNIQADLKDSEHGQTPLSWATRNGHESVIKVLLESGKVDADSIDSGYGQTPLSWAARNGNVAFVKLLLNTGKVAVDSKDIEYGRTPLWWASRNGHEGIVKLLIETGKVDPDSKDNGYGRTPLWWAARNGHESIAKLLLKTSKVEINLKDSEFCQTPLSWAARNGHEAVVKILLKSSDNIEVDSKDNGYRQTPLSWAARNGHTGIVNLLLETNNVEADVKDKYSQTPLSWAAQNGHDAVIKLLLESGKVDISLKDTQYNRKPLSWAIRNKHGAVVELLLANGAGFELSRQRPTTSIH